jgi:hypothetical protein
MSCRHNLANTRCSRCYPETGSTDPGPEEDYEPNMEGPGAVTREQYRETVAASAAWNDIAHVVGAFGTPSSPTTPKSEGRFAKAAGDGIIAYGLYRKNFFSIDEILTRASREISEVVGVVVSIKLLASGATDRKRKLSVTYKSFTRRFHERADLADVELCEGGFPMLVAWETERRYCSSQEDFENALVGVLSTAQAYEKIQSLFRRG